MSFAVAYSFGSTLSLPQMIGVLQTQTRWPWLERDSELWGEYISAQATPKVIFRIFVEGDHYLAELKFLDDAQRIDWQAEAEALLQQVLPHVGATDVAEAETNN